MPQQPNTAAWPSEETKKKKKADQESRKHRTEMEIALHTLTVSESTSQSEHIAINTACDSASDHPKMRKKNEYVQCAFFGKWMMYVIHFKRIQCKLVGSEYETMKGVVPNFLKQPVLLHIFTRIPWMFLSNIFKIV